MVSFSFGRNFQNHVSDISYKAYIGKAIICLTLAKSTVIIILYLCMITTCRFSVVHVHKESSLVWPDSFIAQGVYHLQYKHPTKALSMVIMLHSYLYVLAGLAHNCMQHMSHSASYYFHLKLWIEQLQLQLATCCSYTSIDLSLNARTIHNTHGSQLQLQHQQL